MERGEKFLSYSIFFKREVEYDWNGTADELRELYPEAPEGVVWEEWIKGEGVSVERMKKHSGARIADESWRAADYVDVSEETAY